MSSCSKTWSLLCRLHILAHCPAQDLDSENERQFALRHCCPRCFYAPLGDGGTALTARRHDAGLLACPQQHANSWLWPYILSGRNSYQWDGIHVMQPKACTRLNHNLVSNTRNKTRRSRSNSNSFWIQLLDALMRETNSPLQRYPSRRAEQAH